MQVDIIKKGEKINAIGDLSHKTIHRLYLMSCNSGHIDLYRETNNNAAAAFGRLGGIDEVHAFNGSMAYQRMFNHKARLSNKQNGFYDVYTDFGLSAKPSTPSGWVVYVYVN